MKQGRRPDNNRIEKGEPNKSRLSGSDPRRRERSTSGSRPDTIQQKRSGSHKKSPAKPDGPILPPLLEDLISRYITEKTEKSCDDPVFLERLRQAIIVQKASYWREKPGKSVKYGRGYDILSYLAYQVPVYFSQFRSLLQDLENQSVLPKDLVALDIGTGPGVVPLAIIDLWKDQKKGTLDIFSIERSAEHIEAFRYLTDGYAQEKPGINIHQVLQEDLTKISDLNLPTLPEKAGLITFQNVLAELEHLSIPARAAIVNSYARLLNDDGFLIIVEPAELRHATSLRLLQKELIKSGLHVYAPCSYLWGSGCDPTSCWTFREETPIQPTSLMTLLAGEEEGYRFINTDRKYAYVILTKQQKTRCTYRVPRKTRMVRLSHLEKFAGRLISVAGVRMSGDIGNRGMHIFKFCDGTCKEPTYLVLSARNRRPGHAPLFASGYGDPLTITGVQVRRHQQHKAWNLVISQDSRIEPAVPAREHRSGDPAQSDEVDQDDFSTSIPHTDKPERPSPSSKSVRVKKTRPADQDGRKVSRPFNSRREKQKRIRRGE